ncbi:MAG: monovalent cation/H+ antiporter subunit D [Burkholderiales bacterium]|nr:monovalent cation/H+ antiporter subunit D [Burkholderiales bacterium]
MTTHLAVLPVVIPALAGALLLALGSRPIGPRRAIGLIATALQLAVAWALLVRSAEGGPIAYFVGDWPAPFGIALVVDRLAALLLVTTSVVALCALVYARAGWDAHGRYFHALFQFQLMGLAGAFLTGDLFNLFVFFEVLLIASYTLLLHGRGEQRVRAALHYVVLNLIGSSLFLIAASLLYSVAGTLNMADLALRVRELSGTEAAIARSAGMMLLVVFSLKAALFPLYFWLPAAYAAATAPVAALFAIMTKVGVYAIVRMFVLVFGGPEGLAAWAAPGLAALGIATMLLGVLGALAAHRLAALVAYLTVSSVGTIIAAVALFGAGSLAGAIYYMVHSTLAVAALFLLAEIVAAQRGAAADRLQPAAALANPTTLGVVFLLGAASVAGLPPLSGFVGKLMILQGTQDSVMAPWIWTAVLVTGFLTLIGVARAGSILFWQAAPGAADATPSGVSAGTLGPALALVAAAVLMAVLADPITRFAHSAAAQLLDRAAYVEAVLGPLGGADARTVRPLPGVNRR